MNHIASEKKLVLGSETATWWAVPYLTFAHGNFSVHNSIHWEFSKKREQYGKYWPSNRPEFFFKTINAPKDYIKARYNPQYRIPLFQVVYHQSIVTTDRWEISHMKIINALQTRELLELLYGVPAIWSLDLADINKYGDYLKKLYQFFAPIHQAIATEELREFRWLDDKRQVQQTIFGDKIQLTANFSNKMYNSIKPYTIQALWLGSNIKQQYTPLNISP